jgi:hypothetical protein
MAARRLRNTTPNSDNSKPAPNPTVSRFICGRDNQELALGLMFTPAEFGSALAVFAVRFLAVIANAELTDAAFGFWAFAVRADSDNRA